MGASFVSFDLPGELTQAQVKDKFAGAQAQDRYENGHSYSGGIGMASGLIFIQVPPFETPRAAYKYLDESCEKWEEARAVRFKDDAGNEHWMIGAVCAS